MRMNLAGSLNMKVFEIDSTDILIHEYALSSLLFWAFLASGNVIS